MRKPDEIRDASRRNSRSEATGSLCLPGSRSQLVFLLWVYIKLLTLDVLAGEFHLPQAAILEDNLSITSPWRRLLNDEPGRASDGFREGDGIIAP